jgi:FkbM family methyltransferase
MQVNETIHALRGEFSVLDLGSADSADLPALRPFRSATTLIELDALDDSQTSTTDYYRKITLKGVICGRRERRVFHQRKFTQASSFLDFEPVLVSAYGLNALFETTRDVELETETLESLLGIHGLERVDFIKTDLEGIDFEVLSSASKTVQQSLVVQSELRFQPLYRGEPPFHTVAAFLSNLGFELITLYPEFWAYATPYRHLTRDGRLAWADAIFFLNNDRVHEIFGTKAWLAFVKQIILAKALGLNNYAEYIYETMKADLPPTIRTEMQEYLKPPPNLQQVMIKTANAIAQVPGGGLALTMIRRLCRLMLKTLPVSRRLQHIAPAW